ncbi:MAG: twin-arginine translocation signal domain-containing protein [Acidobacteria bacterium]|nr:twin-arginine translocation signal domain-containing protein [Acidobacteriota bacterium]MCB9396720.1 twin-arginine translocation signal domain-containing protein [Acidobacteriota bacterium]
MNWSRRSFIKASAAGIAATGLSSPLWAKPTAPGGTDASVGYFERFGVNKDIIRKVMATALETGGDFADLYFQHKVTNYFILRDGAVNQAYGQVGLGVGIRVVKGDQVGFGFSEDLSLSAMQQTARTASVIASGAAGKVPDTFQFSKNLPSRYQTQIPWDQVRAEEKLPLLNGINEKTFKMDKRVVKANITFMDESEAILVATSDGKLLEDIRPMTLLYLTCVAEQDGKRESNTYGVAGREDRSFYSSDRIERIVKSAVDRTTILFDAVPAPAGEMPIVMAAGASGILLHEAIGHGMEADFNRKGVSIYSDKLNKSIAQPFVNIVDEATQNGARGAINFDDEGNPADKTMLVENGILTTYLHDQISAKHYKLKPTGNGRRESYKYAPMPRMRSTYMLPGPHKEAEIVQSVKKGIYCENFTNGQVNIGAGDFTFYVKNGYLIEDGKLTKPIKDINIIGNGPKVLEKIDMVADNLVVDEGGWTCGKNGQSVPVSQGIPTVRVSSITVGGRNA